MNTIKTCATHRVFKKSALTKNRNLKSVKQKTDTKETAMNNFVVYTEAKTEQMK